MKKILVALALTAIASTASALIAGGRHDMRAGGRTTGNLSTCQYCHAPHVFSPSNISTGTPLWNRNQTATLTNYSSNTLNDATVSIGTATRTCLSCHDGTASANPANVNNGGPSAAIAGVAGNWNIGQDLNNDHPVGVNYVAGSEYRTTPAENMPLYASQVECASCHEPHISVPNFVRDTTDMCANCHIK